jgi:hypothetical protein|tara:strand:- start:694 stop:1014 length:321 start_codon:yes stop_codon:yes gene_type:complete
MEFGPVLESVASVFALLITLSVIVERGLATLFGWKYYVNLLGGRGLKVPIAFGVSFLIANQVPVDLVAMLFNGDTSVLGQVLTAGLLSGGSKKVAETFGDIKAAVG